jgi:hypothetical protein
MIEQESSAIDEIGNAGNSFFHIYAVGSFPLPEVTVDMTPPQSKHHEFEILLRRRKEQNRFRGTDRNTLTLANNPVQGDKKLYIPVAPSTFSEFNDSRDEDTRQRFQDDLHKVDPIGTSVVIRTSDEQLLLASEPYVENPSINVIGGYPEVHKGLTRRSMHPDIDGEGKWVPHRTITRELFEEAGIVIPERNLEMTGVIFNRASKQPIVLFGGEVSLTTKEIRELHEHTAQDNNGREIDVRFAKNNKQTFEALLSHPYGLIRTATATLLFYGREQFGDEWFQRWQWALENRYKGEQDMTSYAVRNDQAYIIGEKLVV